MGRRDPRGLDGTFMVIYPGLEIQDFRRRIFHFVYCESRIWRKCRLGADTKSFGRYQVEQTSQSGKECLEDIGKIMIR